MANNTNLKTIQAGAAPMATDIDQIRMALSGIADLGYINLAPKQATPVAPTLVASSTAGVLNGTYKYQLVPITGWKDSYSNLYISGFAPGAEGTISVTSKSVNVTIPAFSAPVIAYAIYRTPAAGATGTEKYVGIFTNIAGGTFNDNLADGSIGTGMATSSSTVSIPAAVPTTNTTGTALCLGNSSNNITSTTPLYLVLPNVNAMGMDQYGNLMPVQPGAITTGNAWNVNDKNAASVLKVLIDGTTSPAVVSSKGYGGLGRVSGYSYYCSSLASGSSITLTHNLGYNPIVAIGGTSGNLQLTYNFISSTQISVTNYSSGANAWAGNIYCW